ncbi:MAG: DUF1926 domain-containing protein [Candidatus Omnitrophica bacterium]|nr:DUF1926 domain-containing protein [Candidatus Omnitrophota bacterium]
MCFHFHQPVGNFNRVIDKICDDAYLPLLKLLLKFPQIKANLHFSGALLEWLDMTRPEIIKIIKELTVRGQTELLGGAFYEPIFAFIPREDASEQIKLLSRYVEDKFSFVPKGIWVPERVWQPELAGIFHETGIKYAVLDDAHLIYNGLTKEETCDIFETGTDGNGIFIFPANKTLRYMIPFETYLTSVAYMKGLTKATARAPVFTYADDAEKFGAWPGTKTLVYGKKWLAKFFKELTRNNDWLDTLTFSECIERKKERPRKVHLWSCAYEEMMEWSLPGDIQEEHEYFIGNIKILGKKAYLKDVVGTDFWNGFFRKYPEAEYMHERMLSVSAKLHAMMEENQADASRQSNGRCILTTNDQRLTTDIQSLLMRARIYLYKAQCNCAYWHGIFGGLYLFHLRQAVYRNIIQCEKLIEFMKYGAGDYLYTDFQKFGDLDDGTIIFANKNISLYCSPGEGGVLKEIDDKKNFDNLINTLGRHKEFYHKRVREIFCKKNKKYREMENIYEIFESRGIDFSRHLDYDGRGRHNFIDHFMRADTDFKNITAGSYPEIGNFSDAKYGYKLEKTDSAVSVVLKKEGKVLSSAVAITKKFILPTSSASFSVDYKLKNMSEKTLDCFFCPEINLTMPLADSKYYTLIINDKKRYKYGFKKCLNIKNVVRLSIRENKVKHVLGINFSEKCRLFHFPIKTVSLSEKAYELNYQGSCFLPCFRTTIEGFCERLIHISVSLYK